MRRYEMNEYQKAIMNIELMYPNTPVCNIGGLMYFDDGVDKELIMRAAAELIAATPVLRLRCDAGGMLYVSDEDIVPIELALPEEEDSEAAADRLIREPFELTDSPLCLFLYVETASERFGFMKLHHILGDHVALLSFFKRLEKIYIALLDGTYKRKAPDTRYFETMLCGGKREFPEARKFYGERFEKYGEGISPRRLRSTEAGMFRYKWDEKTAADFLDFCHDNSVKPESVIYAALAVYEKQTTGRGVSVFGRVMMNRGRGELDVFGLYTNTAPVFVSAEDGFAEVCAGAERELSEGTRFSAYPLDRLLDDNGIGERCFDISVSFISLGMMPRLRTARPEKRFSGHTELPMRIHVLRSKKELEFNIEYAKELYRAEETEAFALSLMSVIRSGISGAEPECLTEADRAAYAELNDVKYIDADTTVSRLFSKYAAGHGSETAVEFEGGSLSFAETEAMANVIAEAAEGSRLVGIAVGRGKYLVPAMLGALKAGAAYMPIDPRYPIPDGCDRLFTVSRYPELCGDGAVILDRLDYSRPVARDRSDPKGEAYRLRTSGSTGTPKSVRISNGSLYLRLKWMDDTVSLKRRVLQKTSVTFDVSGWELLCGAFGGCCVLPEEGVERDLDAILRYIEKYEIEMIHFVPSMLRLFVRYVKKGSCGSLKTVISSGEALDAKTVKMFCDKLPDTELYNLYGPTECTIDVSYCRCTGGEDEITIGKPVYNTGIYITAPDGSAVPRGVKGEITVTGDLVGMGYAEGKGGYGEFRGRRAYYTGDIGYLGFDGNIHYCGRRDQQVKINGKRTELGETESLLLGIDGVTDAAAVYSKGRVFAYYSADGPISGIKAELSRLTDRLPSTIVYVKNMPVTASGKKDAAALLRLKPPSEHAAPSGAAEETILRLARETLSGSGNAADIGVEDELFDAGLDSLSALSLMLKLRDAGFEFTVQDIYANPTVRMLAKTENAPGLLVRLGGVTGNGILCCFPYAGGQPQAFEKIAEQSGCETFGVNYDIFEDDCAIEDIAERVCAALKGRGEIRIAAACVGSAAALETARRLEAAGETVKAVYIMGSLPSVTRSGKNPWRRAGERGTRLMLGRLTALPENFSADGFMRDTDRYFKYMAKNTPSVSAKGYIAFAKGDIFTKGYGKKSARWQRYFKNGFVTSVFDTASHYFMSDTDELLVKMERGGEYV